MNTMRAAIFDASTKQLTIENVPIPEPGPGEVLVRVKACGICLSDVHLIDGALQAPLPRVIPGHESAGVIERVGEYVPPAWKPGQRVLMMGGYLHTRDIGTIDPEGYLLITDRIKDVVKSGGEWISSLAIEDIISQYPGVSEVAVIGIPGEKWGERPLALIVLQQENASGISERHIQAHVRAWAERGVISKWAVPEVRFVDFLEKTSVGKLDKKVLRRKHG